MKTLIVLIVITAMPMMAQPSKYHAKAHISKLGDSSVTFVTVRDQRPALAVNYSVNLTSLAVLTVSCSYNVWDTHVFSFLENTTMKRICTGLIEEVNTGRVIAFDPSSIADKLIEPSLVPLVHQWAPLLIERDKIDCLNRTDWWDEMGQHWVKAGAK